MTSQELQSMVDALMEENKIGDQFSAYIPSEWPTEAWKMVLNAKSHHWDTESLHWWVAGHVHAPEEIVRTLAKSEYRRVRSRIASKRNLPIDLFFILAKDTDEGVRHAIKTNKKAPPDIVEYLKSSQPSA